MKYDKERRNEVVRILSLMKSKQISEEEGEQQLDSFSPQLVENVRKTLEEGWKPQIQVDNQVKKRKWEDIPVPSKALVCALPLIGAYVVFAASMHIINFSQDWNAPSYAPWLSNPLLARFLFGILGIVFGFAAAGLSKTATLLSAVWIGGAGYVFGLSVAPVLLAALILLVFISQIALKTKNLKSFLVAAGTALAGIGAAFLCSAFIEIQGAVPLPEALDNALGGNLRIIMIGAGSILGLAGIVMTIIGIKRK
jgi:hypothetical protein